jgi:hypothetical protein
MLVILATLEAEIRRITVQSQPVQIVCKTLSQKYSTQKETGRVAQVVKSLPNKHKDLSSNPTKKKTRLHQLL